MPLPDQKVSLSYGQGLDTKTDSKQVPAGKLLALQDMVFNGKKLIKRNGQTSIVKTTVGGNGSAVAAAIGLGGGGGPITLTAKVAGYVGNGITLTTISGGTAGSEVVTADGPNITVKIASGTSTGTQVQAAINAAGSPASVWLTASGGTSATMTSGSTATLSGGRDAGLTSRTLQTPKMIRNYKGELVTVDTTNNRMYSYSTQEAAWVDKGYAPSIAVTSKTVSSSAANQIGANSVLMNNLLLTVWDNQATSSYMFNIWDTNTNTALVPDTQLPGVAASFNGLIEAGGIRPVVLGGSTFAVVYPAVSGGTLSILNLTLITFSQATGLNFGATTTVANDFGGADAQFDVIPTSTGGAIVYGAGSGAGVITPSLVKTITVNTSGTVVNSATVGPTIRPQYPTLCLDPNTNNIFVYWVDGTPAAPKNPLNYVVYTSALASVLTTTTIVNPGQYMAGMTAMSTGSGTQTVAFQYYDGGNINTGALNVFQADLNSAGTVSNIRFLAYNVTLASKYFTANGNSYILLASTSSAAQVTNQPTYFIIDVITRSIVGRFFAGAAGPSFRFTAIASYSPNLPTPIQVSSTMVQMTVGENVLTTSGFGNTAAAVTLMTFDFNNSETLQSIPLDTLVTNGSILKMYDGNSNVELGYNLFPEVALVSNVTTGGTLAQGTYAIVAVYRWIDRNGDVYWSDPSNQLSVTTGATSTSTIVVNAKCLSLTDKQFPRVNVDIVWFMTQVNGTVLQFIGSNTNVPLGGHVSQTIVAAASGSSPFIYTTGSVLPNDPPPPALAMAAHNNRLMLVDSTDKNTLWYSKTIRPLTGLGFSGNLIVEVDKKGGDINALAEMDEKLVILEANIPFYMIGDGANDTGTGVTWTTPNPIPTDSGALVSRGCFTSPLGVHFKSPKGYYLLDRSLSVRYWGADIEAYNGQDVSAGIIMPNTTRFMFLSSTGTSLMFDYFYGQWGTFSNYQVYAADLWQNTLVVARTDGAIYQENTSGFFMDNTTPYGWLIQTAWIRADAVQGLERLKEFLQLGDYTNGVSNAHGLQVSVAYDFGANTALSGFIALAPYYPQQVTGLASGPLQFRGQLPFQKAESVQFQLQEVVTGNSGESINLTDATMVIGVKKGAFKVPAVQSVG